MDRHHDLYDRHVIGRQHQLTIPHNQHHAVEVVDERLKAMKHNQLQGQDEHRRILQDMTMIEHGGGSGRGPSPLMHSCLSSVSTHFATNHATVARHHQEQPLFFRTAAFSYGSEIPQQQPILCAPRITDTSLKEQLLRSSLSSTHRLSSAAAPSAGSIVVSRAQLSPSFGLAPYAYIRQVSASSSSNNDICQDQQDTSLRRQALLQQELEDLRQRKAVLMNNYELRQHKQPPHFSLPPEVLPTTTGTSSNALQKQHEREYQLQQELERQKQKVMELEAENARLLSRRSNRPCFDPAASASICLIHQPDLFAHQEELRQQATRCRQLQQQSQPHYATCSPLAAASAIPLYSKTSLATNKSRMLVQAHLPQSIRDEFVKQRQLQISASYPQHTHQVYDVLCEARRVLKELPSGTAGAVADTVPKLSSAHCASFELEESQSAVHQQVLESAQEIAQLKKAMKLENHRLAAPSVCTGVPRQVAAAATQDHEDEGEVPLLPRSEPKLEPKKEKKIAAKKKEPERESKVKPDLPRSVASSDDSNAPEGTDPAEGGSIDKEVTQEIKEEHAAELFKNRNEALEKHKRKQENEKKAKCKDLQWKYSYDQLKAHKQEYGDCFVPRGFVGNPSLGSWVAGQRKQYKRIKLGKNSALTEERSNMLEELGFAWNAQKAAWEGHFENLVKFHAKCGHCHVSLNDTDSPKLGLWVKEQRRHYGLMHAGRQTHMNAERAKQLEDLGFCWDTREASWMVRFLELSKYKEEHGDCCPPADTELGTWIKFQHRQYQRLVDKEVGHHVLTQERIDKLNSIGFDWTMVDDSSKRSKPKNMSMMTAEPFSSLESKSKKRTRSPTTLDGNHEEEDTSDGEEEQENDDCYPSYCSSTVSEKADEEGNKDDLDEDFFPGHKDKKQTKFDRILLSF